MRILCKGAKPKYYAACINWPNIEARELPAGTPISSNGTVANDERAIGLLAEDIKYEAILQVTDIIVRGACDLKAVEESIGYRLSADCKQALPDIFKPELPPSLPKVTEADNGKILMVVDGEWKAVKKK